MLSNEFLQPDPYLEKVKTAILKAGRFNIDDVKKEFKVGYRRAVFLRDALIAEGIVDPEEIDGQNWLAGALIIQEEHDSKEAALSRAVGLVGPGGVRDFEKLVNLMAIDRPAVLRLVILAGVKSLLNTLDNRLQH